MESYRPSPPEAPGQPEMSEGFRNLRAVVDFGKHFGAARERGMDLAQWKAGHAEILGKLETPWKEVAQAALVDYNPDRKLE